MVCSESQNIERNGRKYKKKIETRSLAHRCTSVAKGEGQLGISPIMLILSFVEQISEQIYTRYQLYFARCNYYQIVNLTSVQSVKVVQKYFG